MRLQQVGSELLEFTRVEEPLDDVRGLYGPDRMSVLDSRFSVLGLVAEVVAVHPKYLRGRSFWEAGFERDVDRTRVAPFFIQPIELLRRTLLVVPHDTPIGSEHDDRCQGLHERPPSIYVVFRLWRFTRERR